MGKKGDIKSSANPGLAHHTDHHKGTQREATATETPGNTCELNPGQTSDKTIILSVSPCDAPALLGLRSGNLRIGWGQAVERVCSLTTSVCNCDSEVLNDMTANLSMAFGEH